MANKPSYEVSFMLDGYKRSQLVEALNSSLAQRVVEGQYASAKGFRVISVIKKS